VLDLNLDLDLDLDPGGGLGWWTWVVDLGGIGLQLRTSGRGKRRVARRTILYLTTILHYSTLLYHTLLYELYQLYIHVREVSGTKYGENTVLERLSSTYCCCCWWWWWS